MALLGKQGSALRGSNSCTAGKRAPAPAGEQASVLLGSKLLHCWKASSCTAGRQAPVQQEGKKLLYSRKARSSCTAGEQAPAVLWNRALQGLT
jgi:hypothetical protein